MKKIIFALLAALLVFGFVACDNGVHEEMFKEDNVEIVRVDYAPGTEGKILIKVVTSEKANKLWYRIGTEDNWTPMSITEGQEFTEEELLCGIHFKASFTRVTKSVSNTGFKALKAPESIYDETVLSALYDLGGWLVQTTETTEAEEHHVTREYLLKSENNDYYYCTFKDSELLTDADNEPKKGTLTKEGFAIDNEPIFEFCDDQKQDFSSVDELKNAADQLNAYLKKYKNEEISEPKPIGANIGPSEVVSYTVSFEPNYTMAAGSSFIMSQQIKENQFAIKPADPSRYSYTFGGWFETAACDGTEWNFATSSVSDDTVLYAKWNVIPVTGISLNYTTINKLSVGSTLQLIATVEPSDATDQTVTWSSSDSTVATVDTNGLVTAVKSGNVTITAKANGTQETVTCQCTVSTNNGDHDVTGVSLDKETMTLFVGGSTGSLTATIAPSNADVKDVTWSTSDGSIATVTGGVVTAVAPGSATITVTTVQNSKTDTCSVTVKPAISLNKDTLSLYPQGTETLTATVEAGKTVEWSSSNTDYVTVNASTGEVTAVAVGSATVKAKISGTDYEATCTVTVSSIPVTGVTLNKTTTTIVKGQTDTLTATIAPTNATNKNVTWTSSKESVATVNDGVVTAVAGGEATITVTTADGSKTATCVVTVTVPVTGVTLDKTTTTIVKGQTETLTATIDPENATNQNVTWSSSKESVATVDNNGVVTAVDGGEATITVTTADGSKTATCVVTVTVPVSKVELDKSSLTMYVGNGTQDLEATVSPENATNKNVTWTSDTESVATVSQAGRITAVAAGSAKITVKSNADETKFAECTVTVKPAIALDKSTATIDPASETKTVTLTADVAVGKTVEWSSSDNTVATVSDGVVTQVGPGVATITAKITDTNYTATCEVTVKGIKFTTVQGGYVVQKKKTLNMANIVNVYGGIEKSNITWSCEGDGSISGLGTLTAADKDDGTVTVTATFDESYSASISVKVSKNGKTAEE